MTNHRLFASLIFLLLSFPLSGWATDWPTLDLLKTNSSNLPKPQTIKVNHDPVYKTAKEYQAYPLAEILEKIRIPDSFKKDELVIVFTSADGYKVSMAYSDAFTEQGFIAFKDNASTESKGWLDFKFGKQIMTPAPFYLVWPKKNLDEWRYPWPFQLVSLSLQSAKSYFGAAAPAHADARINKGFALFSRYCIRCHSINLSGGKVGPELNIPKNITEYFKEEELDKFILNAAAYRAGTKMPNFENIITADEARDIVLYLKQMRSEKLVKSDE
ncbi:MAG: cytochrome c [Methylococcales bacterium]|nr:cytochrome c [Methylococcales bacterium]